MCCCCNKEQPKCVGQKKNVLQMHARFWLAICEGSLHSRFNRYVFLE